LALNIVELEAAAVGYAFVEILVGLYVAAPLAAAAYPPKWYWYELYIFKFLLLIFLIRDYKGYNKSI